MAAAPAPQSEDTTPLTQDADMGDMEYPEDGRPSVSSVSTTSLILEHASDNAAYKAKAALYEQPLEELDVEEDLAWQRQVKPADKKVRRVLYILMAIGAVGWVAAFFLFLSQDRHVAHSARPHDPHATATVGNGKKVTLEQVLTGDWYARTHDIRWIPSPKGEDGLLLERGGSGGKDYLVVEDVRYRGDDIQTQKSHSVTLMKRGEFNVDNHGVVVEEAWPSPNHTKVLVRSDYASNWRHSGTGRYWIFDVATQSGEALDPANVYGRIQVASWSPNSDAIVFTRDNNMFIRHLDSNIAQRITTDGGSELFYGVPDWVYEEEVLAGDSATWWSGDGKYVAFFRTDESKVPSFPVQYFFSSPTGRRKKEGEENYPETRQIKYPKAGASEPVVSLQLYDVERNEVFTVPIDGDFPDDDRILTEVVWADNKVIVRSTNRESDVLKTIIIDAVERVGRTVRERDVQKLDGGWFEVSETTTFVPADPENGRMHDGYIDTVIYNNYDHLAYFSPLENPEPQMLTEGNWEVVKAPSSVDLANNLVYFIATREGSTQRHIYTVDLMKGISSINPVTDTNEIGYYDATFSAGSQFMLLTYNGPHIPYQKVLATPSNKADQTDISIEMNKELRALAQETELPIEIYQTVNVDGFDLNLVERRPPHFDESGRRKYPVLFYLYNGPGFQQVDRRFTVDFQSFIASSLGYIVVTVDGRGTGYLGRKHRTIVRGNIGYWEAHDQIETAKMWARKKYVDADNMAIWGWSYGGFMTLKTLEMDGGETFKYGT